MSLGVTHHLTFCRNIKCWFLKKVVVVSFERSCVLTALTSPALPPAGMVVSEVGVLSMPTLFSAGMVLISSTETQRDVE